MSEPVSNVEIEDVLSSIRRLVSENSRTGPRSEKPEETQEDAAEASVDETLVLTPALRVSTEAGETSESDESQMDPAGSDAYLSDSDRIVEGAGAGEGDINEVPTHIVEEAARVAVGEAIEKTVSDAFGDLEAENTADADATADEAALGESEVFEVGVQTIQADDNSGVWATDSAGARLEDRIAELEAVVAGREEQWEPDGNGEDDYAAAPVETMTWEDHDPGEGSTSWSRDEDVSDGADAEFDAIMPVEDEWLAAQEDPAGARLGLGQVADAELSDGREALSDTQDAPSEQIVEDPQEPVGGPDTEELSAGDGAVETPDFLSANDEILDEDTLRDLVAEIVRQELQGTLGERITRNVRKLVRREIHRALAAQELD